MNGEEKLIRNFFFWYPDWKKRHSLLNLVPWVLSPSLSKKDPGFSWSGATQRFPFGTGKKKVKSHTSQEGPHGRNLTQIARTGRRTTDLEIWSPTCWTQHHRTPTGSKVKDCRFCHNGGMYRRCCELFQEYLSRRPFKASYFLITHGRSTWKQSMLFWAQKNTFKVSAAFQNSTAMVCTSHNKLVTNKESSRPYALRSSK